MAAQDIIGELPSDVTTIGVPTLGTIQEPSLVLIVYPLVKWWWTTRNGRRETQCSSTLCGCLCTHPSGVVLCNHFKWDILWFISIKNHVIIICVPTTLAKRIFFGNHMNKKVVGGKHNVLVHYVDVYAPTHLVLSSVTISNEIFCGSFLSKIML